MPAHRERHAGASSTSIRRDTVTPSVTSVTAVQRPRRHAPDQRATAGHVQRQRRRSEQRGQGVANGIGWNFNSGSQAFNFLPAGQTLTLTYNVRATDSSGAANNTDNQPVTITITGTNDGVVANADTRTIAENANAGWSQWQCADERYP